MIVQLAIIGGAYLFSRAAPQLGIRLPGAGSGPGRGVDPCAHGEVTFINALGVPTLCRPVGPIDPPPVFNCIMAPCPGDRGYPDDLPMGVPSDPGAPWFLSR